MKRLVALIAVIALTAPVYATVDITLSVDVPSTTITVGYDATSAGGDVSGLGFTVHLTDGALITSITPAKTGISVTGDKGFGIFLGSDELDLSVPETPVWGDPIDDQEPQTAGYTGVDSSGMHISIGALYDGEPNKPDTTGTLFTFEYDCNGASDFDVEIAADSDRAGHAGGVVLVPAVEGGEPGTDSIVPDALNVSCLVADCFPSDAPYSGQQTDWVAMGRPECWCNSTFPLSDGYQCKGDADGITGGGFSKYRIYTGDLNLVVNKWRLKIGDWEPTDPLGVLAGNLNPCADVDHIAGGGFSKYRVYTGDLNRIVGNWRKKGTENGGPLQPNCPLTDAANSAYLPSQN